MWYNSIRIEKETDKVSEVTSSLQKPKPERVKTMKQPNRAERRKELKKQLLKVAKTMVAAGNNIRLVEPEFDGDSDAKSVVDGYYDGTFKSAARLIAYTARDLKKYDLYFDLPVCVLVEIHRMDGAEATSKKEAFGVLGTIQKVRA
jgi:hypothetical protein